MSRLKPGPIQKKWLENLRKYPERQMKNKLGKKIGDTYQACCLGELHLTYLRKNGIDINTAFNEVGSLFVKKNDCPYFSSLINLENYGIRSGSGDVFGKYIPTSLNDSSLANMNDSGITWPEIADFVEENFELIFNKSV